MGVNETYVTILHVRVLVHTCKHRSHMQCPFSLGVRRVGVNKWSNRADHSIALD
jgi:hypothetical protein